MGRQRLTAWLLAALMIGVTLTACGPEANRNRGGGEGADTGNVGETIEMHGDVDPFDQIYYQTPRKAEENR